MSSLDEISFKLGEVSAGLNTLLAQDTKRGRQITDLQASVGEIKTRMKPLADDVTKMKPHVSHYAGVRRFAGAIVAGIVTVSAAFGGLATTFIEKKWFS